MFIALVPILFFLLWLFLFSRSRDLRRAFLETTLLVFAFIAVTAEALSIFRFLNSCSVTFVWLAACFALVVILRKRVEADARAFFRELIKKLVAVPKLYLFPLGFVYLLTLVIASVAPPNTYDSMTYHMSRAAHWAQAGSVEFYPTAILRQLYQPPLAEYAILQFQLLAGSDLFANHVQWFAFVARGAVVSLIVRELGFGARTQGCAAVISATIPIAIIQSSSTQNDIIASLFILAFFYFFVRAVRSNSRTDFGWTGLALGLALLTKATAYLFCFPMGAAFVAVYFFSRAGSFPNFVRRVALVLLIAAAFNAPHYARNFNLFGSPMSSGEEEVTNKNVTAMIVFSNVARNYAVNLGAKSAEWNAWIQDGMTWVFGDELENRNSTFGDENFVVKYTNHEVSAGNFVHILLVTLALILLFFIRAEDKKYLFVAAFSIVAGFVLFCALLKYQPWSSRLFIPLFMLGSCLTAIVLARIVPRLRFPIAFFCFAMAFSALFFGDPRRVLSDDWKFILTRETRDKNYFQCLPDAEFLYTEAVAFIRSQPNAPDEVGLYIDNNDFEYPFWVLLKRDFAEKPALFHVGVRNVSARFRGERPMPEFVISIRNETTIEGVKYEKVWQNKIVSVLRKKQSAER